MGVKLAADKPLTPSGDGIRPSLWPQRRRPATSDSQVTAAGLEEGDVEVFAVWTLSTVGGTARQMGSRDGAYCGGNALWTGMAFDCKAK